MVRPAGVAMSAKLKQLIEDKDAGCSEDEWWPTARDLMAQEMRGGAVHLKAFSYEVRPAVDAACPAGGGSCEGEVSYI